jgi:hypothetical protein
MERVYLRFLARVLIIDVHTFKKKLSFDSVVFRLTLYFCFRG